MEENHDMFLGAKAHLFEKAKELRVRETEAELILWSKLCKKQLGVKFRRQHPIDEYIVDFYCHAHRLVVEVDGEIHNSKENQEYDKLRTERLNEFKVEVIRFTNYEVMNNLDSVLEKIRANF
jgi:very-short-patch-repair endonuclease